ncbi:hypothetical protein N7466_000628 [Penicillium verhagenii]|uniref:uncharacterized protein n=1 Tax=Penicillium verhagenii TaxID=1562060 RepID=UPI002545B7A0|nr:uncharacterized protein N7466_000628 [Penicillium verhagenii]KAJ5947613.1 hypothetical protein N7466_000628 [Penicillium verhagenii]
MNNNNVSQGHTGPVTTQGPVGPNAPTQTSTAQATNMNNLSNPVFNGNPNGPQGIATQNALPAGPVFVNNQAQALPVQNANPGLLAGPFVLNPQAQALPVQNANPVPATGLLPLNPQAQAFHGQNANPLLPPNPQAQALPLPNANPAPFPALPQNPQNPQHTNLSDPYSMAGYGPQYAQPLNGPFMAGTGGFGILGVPHGGAIRRDIPGGTFSPTAPYTDARFLAAHQGVQGSTTVHANTNDLMFPDRISSPSVHGSIQRNSQIQAAEGLISGARAPPPGFRTRTIPPRSHYEGPYVNVRDTVSVALSSQTPYHDALHHQRVRIWAVSSWLHDCRDRQRMFRSGNQAPVNPPGHPIGVQPPNQPPNQPLNPQTSAQESHSLSDEEVHDAQPRAAGLDSHEASVPTGPPQHYNERDLLQARLIRVQLVAGIPPDEVISMDSWSREQARLGERRSFLPSVLRVQQSSGDISIPEITPARFHGRIEPLPLSPEGWLPPLPTRQPATTVQSIHFSGSLPRPQGVHDANQDASGSNAGASGSN